jgi:tetratricopeptide (TPR) repeat protein
VCRESRQLCDATGDKRGIALCLQVEALVSNDEGKASEALLQRAAEALHDEGLREAEANVLLMLGTAEADRARFPEARRAYERARGLVQAAESPELAARLASAMADVERRRGRLGEARVLLQESGEIVRRLGQPRELACHLAKEAQLLLDAGEPGGALARALEAVEHAGRAGNPRVEILARQTLAACHLVLGDVRRAQALLAPPVEGGGFPSQDLDGTTHLYLGRSRLQAGDLEGARLSLRLALELALARGDRLLEGACLLEQGLAAIPTGAAGAAEARALLLRVDAVVRDLDLLPGSALARDAERLRLALGS